MKFLSRFLLILLIMLGILFLTRNSVHSYQSLGIPRNMIPTTYLYDEVGNYNQGNDKKQSDMKKEWKKEFKFHEDNGIRCYKDAKSRAWYLPTISDRDKARNCFLTAFTYLGGTTPTTRLISMVVSSLTQISLACMDEYNYIEMKLNWAQYHFEMCDHYSNLIRNYE